MNQNQRPVNSYFGVVVLLVVLVVVLLLFPEGAPLEIGAAVVLGGIMILTTGRAPKGTFEKQSGGSVSPPATRQISEPADNRRVLRGEVISSEERVRPALRGGGTDADTVPKVVFVRVRDVSEPARLNIPPASSKPVSNQPEGEGDLWDQIW